MHGEGGENVLNCVCLVTAHMYVPAAPLHAVTSLNQYIKMCELFLKKANCFNNEMFIPTLLIAEMQ